MYEYDLPNGLLEFDPDKHQYRYNDEIIPGVTSITGGPLTAVEPLMGWVGKLCGEYVRDNVGQLNTQDPVEVDGFIREMKRERYRARDKMGTVGTLVHAFAESYIMHRFAGADMEPELPNNEQAARACLGFVEWVNQQEIVVHGVEQRVLYTGTEGLWPFAGTFDMDATINGKRTLVDWKTSSRFSPSMMAQLGGYDLAMAEMHGVEYEVHMVGRFDRDSGKAEIVESDRPMLNRLAFRSCYELLKFKDAYK